MTALNHEFGNWRGGRGVRRRCELALVACDVCHGALARVAHDAARAVLFDRM